MGIYLIVCPLVFLAGFVDSIAGGGGLISLPAYMFAGIPVHNAIATNKLSSSTGTAVSTARLIRSIDRFCRRSKSSVDHRRSYFEDGIGCDSADRSLLCVERQEYGCGSSGRNDKEQAVSDRDCMLFGDWLL